jgi:hypothetical protein
VKNVEWLSCFDICVGYLRFFINDLCFISSISHLIVSDCETLAFIMICIDPGRKRRKGSPPQTKHVQRMVLSTRPRRKIGATIAFCKIFVFATEIVEDPRFS